MPYDKLLNLAATKSVTVKETSMPKRIKGLYADNFIWINKDIPTNVEKACVLAEELAHHDVSTGNILYLKDVRSKKQELIARQRAHEALIPLSSFVQAHKIGIRSRHELAEYLGVTEEFLTEAIKRYQEKYGILKQVDNYTICFEPLGVVEWFDWEV